MVLAGAGTVIYHFFFCGTAHTYGMTDVVSLIEPTHIAALFGRRLYRPHKGIGRAKGPSAAHGVAIR